MTDQEIKTKRKEILDWERTNRKRSNRSVSDHRIDQCLYQPSLTSPGCAIGRLIDPDLAKLLDDTQDELGVTVDEDHIFDQLPHDIQELGVNFLRALQALHDEKTYWTASGLSETGIKEAELIEQTYT